MTADVASKPDIASKAFAASFALTREVFDFAVSKHPDIMERYVIQLGDASSPVDQQEIMRMGLMETLKLRYTK